MHFAQKLNIRKRVSAQSFSVLSVVVLFFFAILSFVKILFTSHLINIGSEIAEKLYDPDYTTVHKFQSCGWDGVRYCAQFFGGTRVDSPYSRRQIVALAARLFDSDPIAGFYKLNVLSLSFAVLLGLLIAQPNLLWIPGQKLNKVDLQTKRFTFISTLVVTSVFLTSRNTFHLMLSAPVLTDPLGLLLILVSIFCVLNAERIPIFALGCVSSFLLPLAREQEGIAIFGCAGLMFLYGRLRVRQFFILTCFTAVGTLVALNSPSSGKPALSLWETLVWHFKSDFDSRESVIRFGVMLMLSLGCFPIFLARKAVRQALTRPDASILLGAACLFLVSVFGGGDTDRILMPVGILLALVSSRVAIRSEVFSRGYLFCGVQFVVSQSSMTITTSSPNSFLEFFGLRWGEFSSVITNGVVPISKGLLVACLFILIAFVLRPKELDPTFKSKPVTHLLDLT